MKRFVNATTEDFNELDNILEDGKLHVYGNLTLPEGCNPETARIGFEKHLRYYLVLIDNGIETSCDDEKFKNFLSDGEARFSTIGQVAEFFHSMRPLFEEEVEEAEDEPVDTTNIVDRERLRQLRQEENEPKTVWPEEIAQPLNKKVFGQKEAINSISKKISTNNMRKKSALLVIALLGPTATGKSETAKSLAKVLTELYGTEYGLIEVAASEFIGEHTVHRFFGAPPGFVGHGEPTVFEPVRKNPHHIIVLNEIEKADKKLLDGLMETIDTGYLELADNSGKIDLNQCIMLLTSNLPIDMEKYLSLEEFERGEYCRDVFTKHCGRPEISGKIGNFVAFSPLSGDAITEIIIKFIIDELSSYNITLVRIEEELMNDFMNRHTKYGARGIRDLVRNSVGDYLLTDRRLESLCNQRVCLGGRINNIEFTIVQEDNDETDGTDERDLQQ